MAQRKDLAVIRSHDPSVMPNADEWSLIYDMAKALQPTGFLPSGITTPEQAMAIILKGRELGLAPMYALSSISIIKGKPTLSAELMLTLVRKAYGQRSIRVKETTNDRCVVEYRDGWGDVQAYAFTMEDARTAGLTSNDTYRKYPAALLRARCLSAVVRFAFPEVIGGAYVPGELGDDVTVSDDGEVVSVNPATVTAQIHEMPRQDTPRQAQARQQLQAAAQPPQDDRERANKRVHAVGGEHGFSHDGLRMIADREEWAHHKRHITSLKDANAELMDHVSNLIERDPKAERAWIDANRPNDEDTDEPIDIDPETGEMVPSTMSQGEFIDLPAESNPDRHTT